MREEPVELVGGEVARRGLPGGARPVVPIEVADDVVRDELPLERKPEHPRGDVQARRNRARCEPSRGEPVAHAAEVVGGELVDAARTESIEDVIAESLPVEVDGPLRVTPSFVADADARSKMFEPFACE